MGHATAEMIKMEAIKQGMNTLRRSGWEKVMAGITTPEEVLEATEADEISLSEQEIAQASKKESAGREFFEAGLSSRDSQDANISEKEFVDLRKFKRVRCRVPVLYRVIEFRGRSPRDEAIKKRIIQFEFGGVIENICPGGIFFMTPDRSLEKSTVPAQHEMWKFLDDALEAGNVLELKINLPDRESPVECMARILRVMHSAEGKKNDEDPSYSVAMMFLAINSVDRNSLEKFCQAQAVSDETI